MRVGQTASWAEVPSGRQELESGAVRKDDDEGGTSSAGGCNSDHQGPGRQTPCRSTCAREGKGRSRCACPSLAEARARAREDRCCFGHSGRPDPGAAAEQGRIAGADRETRDSERHVEGQEPRSEPRRQGLQPGASLSWKGRSPNSRRPQRRRRLPVATPADVKPCSPRPATWTQQGYRSRRRRTARGCRAGAAAARRGSQGHPRRTGREFVRRVVRRQHVGRTALCRSLRLSGSSRTVAALRRTRSFNLTGHMLRSRRCETQPVTSQAEAKMACFSYIQGLTDVRPWPA